MARQSMEDFLRPASQRTFHPRFAALSYLLHFRIVHYRSILSHLAAERHEDVIKIKTFVSNFS